MNRQYKKGFTLIELMVVIAIIGILAAIAVPQYGDYNKRARFGDVIASTNAVKTAISACYQAQNDFEECDSFPEIPVNDPGSNDNFASVSIEETTAAIIATGTNKVDGKKYTLTPEYINGAISWTPGGDCSAAKLC